MNSKTSVVLCNTLNAIFWLSNSKSQLYSFDHIHLKKTYIMIVTW